jgi:hypothetical protein
MADLGCPVSDDYHDARRDGRQPCRDDDAQRHARLDNDAYLEPVRG